MPCGESFFHVLQISEIPQQTVLCGKKCTVETVKVSFVQKAHTHAVQFFHSEISVEFNEDQAPTRQNPTF